MYMQSQRDQGQLACENKERSVPGGLLRFKASGWLLAGCLGSRLMRCDRLPTEEDVPLAEIILSSFE
jgi:hypothetical protein